MSESGIDLEQQIPPLHLLLVMPLMMAMSWAEGNTPPPATQEPDPLVAFGVDAFLDGYEPFLGSATVDRLRTAVAAGDPAALATLAAMVRETLRDLPQIRQRQAQSFDRGAYPVAIDIGTGAMPLAIALGDDDSAVALARDCARSLFRLGDMERTVNWYERALAAAARLDPAPLPTISLCLDNLSLALSALGRWDEALQRLAAARSIETDPRNQLLIASHTASVLGELGEFDRAVRLYRGTIDALQSLHPDQELLLAIMLDNLAAVAYRQGDTATTITALTQAGEILGRVGGPVDRYKNALSRHHALDDAGDTAAARAAFQEAWEEALRAVEVADEQRFRLGLRAAVATLAPLDHALWDTVNAASSAALMQRWHQAVEGYRQAAGAAGAVDDTLTRLRCLVNAAAVLGDSGDRDQTGLAARWASDARGEGLEAALAPVVALADVALSAMRRRGVEITGTAGDPLLLTAEGLTYIRLHEKLVAELPDPADPRLPAVDAGPLLARVGTMAYEGGDLELAAQFLRSAVDVARGNGHRFGELARSTDLLRVLDQLPGRRADADALAAKLRSRLDDAAGGTTADIQLLHVLSDRPGVSAPVALPDLRRAADLLNRHRGRVPPGGARAHLDTDFPVYLRMLRRQREADAPLADQFATLQQIRARRLVEALTARAGDDAEYQSPDVPETVGLLSRLSTPTTLVDVVVTDTGLRAYLVDADGIRAVDADGDLTPLRVASLGDARRRPAALLRELRRSGVLHELVAAVADALTPGSSVLLSVDDTLANLPFHAVPLRGRPWGDRTVVGRIPSVAVLRFTDPDRRWSGRCVVAGDSDGTLKGARRECTRVAALLDTVALVGPACTLGAVRTALAAGPDLDIAHIAVHGRADARRGGRSSLLFAADATPGVPRWVGLDALFDGGMRADLVVFSGCSTAVGGPRDGAGLYGISQAAAEAGATTVLASLWPVDDSSAAIFMSAFYEELTARRRAGATVVDLREVMDHARRALRTSLSEVDLATNTRARDGREIVVLVDGPDQPDIDTDAEIQEMLHWAPFVLLGDPRLAVA